MPLSDQVQGIIMAVQGAAVTLEAYIASQPLDPSIKTPLMFVIGAIIVILPYAKEVPGANPAPAPTPAK
jgi:VIT1/CCC1 family predicted Fe2+/Mn2+ transporter